MRLSVLKTNKTVINQVNKKISTKCGKETLYSIIKTVNTKNNCVLSMIMFYECFNKSSNIITINVLE